MAVPTTLIYTETFAGSDTTVGSAGSTTGWNNNWTDLNGNLASRINNRGVVVNSVNYRTDMVLQAANFLTANQRIKITLDSAGVTAFTTASTWFAAATLRFVSTTGFYLFCCTGNGTSKTATLFRVVVGGSVIGITLTNVSNGAANTAFTVNPSNGLTIDYSVDGANNFRCTITDTTTSTVLRDVQATDSTYTAAGRIGINAYGGGGATNGQIKQIDLYDSSGVTITPGVATLSSRSFLVANLSSTVPSAGSGNGYTYQWQMSTISSIAGFSNISGATTSTYTYTASGNNLYYFRCVYGDSNANSATSNVITIVLATSKIFLGFVGDSITYGYAIATAPPMITANTLESFFGYRQCILSNQGVTGSTTAQWVVGQTNYTNALSTFNTASSGIVRFVMIMLGANDCANSNNVNKATYKTNLLNLCNGLVSNGYKVILNYPTWTGDTNRSNALLLQYQEAINELVNGNTILQGDTFAYQYFFQNQSQLADTLHPTQTGANNLGTLWADGFWRTVYSVKMTARRLIKF